MNNHAKVNLAIMHSLLGQFEMAKQVINTRWLLLYVSVYVYAMWDSYRGTVELNRHSILADREDSTVKPMVLRSLDNNYLHRQNPLLAETFSLLAPGLGHLYVHKVKTGLFFIVWTIVVMYMSHTLQAVHYTMVGAFSMARQIVDMQWLMYLPSIYGFVLYDTYVSAVANTSLFQKVQSKYLRETYQRHFFKMPL